MMNKKLKKATVAVAALSLAVSGVPTTIFPQNVAIVNASVDDEVFESGDFRYKVTDNNTKVSILGFTESAKEKTTVAIPTTVNYDVQTSGSFQYRPTYNIRPTYKNNLSCLQTRMET